MLPGKQLAFLVNLKPVIANQRWQSNRLGNLRVWALFPFQFQKWIWRLALSIHKIRRNIQGWGSLSVPSKKYPVLIHPELWWFFFQVLSFLSCPQKSGCARGWAGFLAGKQSPCNNFALRWLILSQFSSLHIFFYAFLLNYTWSGIHMVRYMYLEYK